MWQPARPVREWDVGKKEPTDRDKSSNDRRRSSKERIDSRLRDSERGKGADDADRSGQDRKRSRERDRGGRERERSDHGHGRSKSGSPGKYNIIWLIAIQIFTYIRLLQRWNRERRRMNHQSDY